MTARSFAELLSDSTTLAAVALEAGVTVAQARTVAAAFGDLPAETTTRICGTAARDLARQRERARRMKR